MPTLKKLLHNVGFLSYTNFVMTPLHHHYYSQRWLLNMTLKYEALYQEIQHNTHGPRPPSIAGIPKFKLKHAISVTTTATTLHSNTGDNNEEEDPAVFTITQI